MPRAGWSIWAPARPSSRAGTSTTWTSWTCCLTAPRSTSFVIRASRRGTRTAPGCTFAASLAANLALGHALPDAVQRTTDYVAGAIAHGLAIGKGHGPLDHFWNR